MINWHRLFGLMLTDFFLDSPYTVELEKDLSLQRQLLDVVIIEQGEGEFSDTVPDGLENLGRHNLLTYKSLREPLDAWALDELIGHYVNYRKQLGGTGDLYPPEKDFRLYGVSTRIPQKLQQDVQFSPVKQGVYQTSWGTHDIRVIVLSQMPQTPNNAPWQMFSSIPDQVRYGAAQYQWHRPQYSTIMHQLYDAYQVEGISMSYTWDDFFRDYTKEHLKDLTPEEVLTCYSSEELLKHIPLEERLKDLSLEERLKVFFSSEELLQMLGAEMILEKLPAKDLEALLKKLREKHQAQHQN